MFKIKDAIIWVSGLILWGLIAYYGKFEILYTSWLVVNVISIVISTLTKFRSIIKLFNPEERNELHELARFFWDKENTALMHILSVIYAAVCLIIAPNWLAIALLIDLVASVVITKYIESKIQ